MSQKHRWSVILDAGSSGSRVYVYEYKTAEYVKEKDDANGLERLPKIKTKKKWNYKVHPGISTFGEKPELVGPGHLNDLIKFAEDIVPKDEIEDTPIFLLATAGMRLLPEYQRNAVLENVCTYFKRNSRFQLPDCDLHIQVIPGETEGLYGWIAANYLLGGFDKPEKNDHGKDHNTYGFLDMGGASAQIAFAPNATEAEKHANDLKLLRLRKVNGEPMEYGVFVTTWLGFGANEARRRYVEHLLEASPEAHEVPDPCLPAGLMVMPSGEPIEPDSAEASGKKPYLIGTGAFAECLSSTFPLLEKNKPCDDPPCLLNGVHTPAIDFDVNHFVGVSEYWHTTHEVFAMAHKDRAYDFQSYQKQVSELCSRDWEDIEKDVAKEKWGHKVDEKTLEEVCFKASWLINMLHEGIGVPRVGIEQGDGAVGGHANKTNQMLDEAEDRGFLDPFQAVDKIDGTELSWTLGKMVLYASSQMPPAKDAKAVGFGSNIPGLKLPSDFQFPSGEHELLPNTSSGSGKESKDWHDQLLHSSYSRQVPGLIIFLLILAFAAYLLCGRERRTNIRHKVLTLTGRKPGSPRNKRRKAGPLSSKLFGNSEPTYDRVLEEAADPDEFELSDVHSEGRYSDSSTGSYDHPNRTGRTSGMATPSVRGLSPDVARGSPKRGIFDNTSLSSAGSLPHGLGITPFDRGGLIVRAESKERLAPAPSSLGRSRTGSPRRSPLISPLKESVD
ncbi:Golgi apyrase [Vermiconidia calcicola]|uniref:Golgi apyrase n=1 Tax=Vermiconidia calcicola TaxID=1690605 RepID=A0ACC3NRT5_9PEZI|nr:Golgi apyrase [Vermiconidia calcicola]